MHEMTKYRMIIEAAEDATRFKPRNVVEILSKYPEGFADRFHAMVDQAIESSRFDGQSIRIMYAYRMLRDLINEGIIDQADAAEMRDTIIQAMEDKGLAVVHPPKGRKKDRDVWFSMKS